MAEPATRRGGSSYWTKDRAGSTAAAYGAGYAAMMSAHEELTNRISAAYTVSVLIAVPVGCVAYWLMHRFMKRLP